MGVLEQLAAKAKVTGDIGDLLDKDIEAAMGEEIRLQGGYLYLKEGAGKLAALADHIRKDFEEGKYEGMDSKAVHDVLLEYNRKAAECILNLSDSKKSEGLAAAGKLAGLKSALEVINKQHIAATARCKQIVQSIESEEKPLDEKEAKETRRNRAPGEHPGPSSLDARRIEAMKADMSKQADKKEPKSRKLKVAKVAE